MDPLKLLADVKGKVLDAINFDMLKSAYELQAQNLDQLKSNNDAFRENNELLKEKAARLQSDVVRLRTEVERLEKGALAKPPIYTPTGLPLQMLRSFKRRDASSLEDTQIMQDVRSGTLEFEAAIKELQMANLLRASSLRMRSRGDRGVSWGGTTYALSDEGRKLILALPND